MNKLAIVGTGTETRELAPFGDESYDILTFNEAAQSAWCKRWDILFQLHPQEIYTGHNTKNALHWEWLQQEHRDARGNLKPIYMQTTDPRVPNAVAYPLEQARALIPFKYITASVCYALAWAKLQGYQQIDVYGVEMSWTEYEYQAACWRFWVGYMLGAGVKLNLYSSTHLFNSLLYGYEGNFAFGADYFNGEAKQHAREWELTEANAKACAREVERIIKLAKYDQFSAAMQRYSDAMIKSGEMAGRQSEAERYAAFGERFTDRGGFEYAAAKNQRDGKAKEDELNRAFGKVEYVWNAWRQMRNEQAAQQLLQFAHQTGQIAYDVGAMIGMYQENVKYVNKYDAHAKAIGMVRVESHE